MTPRDGRSAWGAGLLTGFLLFVGGVVFMVYVSMSQKVDLVSDRYYDQGLKYQERIRAQERALRMDGGVRVSVSGPSIRLQFPARLSADKISGTVMLYRPADRRSDRAVAITPDAALSQTIPMAGAEEGLWRVQVFWRVGNEDCYNEEPVMIRTGR